LAFGALAALAIVLTINVPSEARAGAVTASAGTTASKDTTSTEVFIAASGSGLLRSSRTTAMTRTTIRQRMGTTLPATTGTARATGRTTRACRAARRRGCRCRLH